MESVQFNFQETWPLGFSEQVQRWALRFQQQLSKQSSAPSVPVHVQSNLGESSRFEQMWREERVRPLPDWQPYFVDQPLSKEQMVQNLRAAAHQLLRDYAGPQWIYDPFAGVLSMHRHQRRLAKEAQGRPRHRPSPHAVECDVSETTLLRLLNKETR